MMRITESLKHPAWVDWCFGTILGDRHVDLLIGLFIDLVRQLGLVCCSLIGIDRSESILLCWLYNLLDLW